jgi:hypothetical protein
VVGGGGDGGDGGGGGGVRKKKKSTICNQCHLPGCGEPLFPFPPPVCSKDIWTMAPFCK